MTPMRGVQIMPKVMIPPKISKNQDVHTQVNKWESFINILEQDYQEVSGMMKVGLLTVDRQEPGGERRFGEGGWEGSKKK